MDVINEAWRPVKNLLGVQKVEDNVDYIMSDYVMRVNGATFNCLTGELVYGDLSREYLINNWYMFRDKETAQQISKKVRKIVFSLREAKKKQSTAYYTIYTTLECNANCFYCYEKKWEKSTMSVDTAKKVAEYILKDAGERDIAIEWFGGEPLCNIPAIDAIANSIPKMESAIVSNGLLVDDGVVKRAVEYWNLKKATISMDGVGDVYNKSKMFKTDAMNPYNVVMSNVGRLLDNGIDLTIRLLSGKHNIESIYELIDELTNRFMKYNNLTVEVLPLDQKNGGIGNQEKDELITYSKKSLRYREYPKSDSPTLPQRCRGNAVIFTPDGSIQVCPDDIEKNLVGDVNGDPKNNMQSIGEWRKYKADETERCINCSLFPSCRLLLNCPMIPLDWNPYECYYNKKHEVYLERLVRGYLERRGNYEGSI